MNSDQIIGIAKEKLTDLRQIDDNVLRGEYHVNKTPVAIYYFDYSENPILLSQLDEFQEKFISTDYYNHSGGLQWNYYLIFIRESVNQETKRDVEQNDIYSRKFILSPSEFESFFKYEKVQNVIKEDIVIKWKDELRKAKLHEVSDKDAPYTKAIERFINDQVPVEEAPPINSQSTPGSIPILKQHIQQLELKSTYRPFPVERLFEFKSVNLINGVNGVGKTSLLEAIELVLCGKAHRYDHSSEPEGSIGISFKGGPIDSFTPRDNAKYQLRDSNWYNNVYVQRNYLSDSFNRYNYFNAEASFRINSDDPAEYKKLLESIALGKEFSFMTERLNGFQTRFQRTDSDLKKRISELELRIKQSVEQRGQLGKILNPEGLLENLSGFLEEIRWKGHSIKGAPGNLSSLENSLTQASTVLKTLNEKREALQLDSISLLKNEKRKLEDLVKKLKAIDEKRIGISAAIQSAGLEKENHQTVLDNLLKFRPYAQTPNILELKGLEKKVTETKKDFEFVENVLALSKEINWVLLTDSEGVLQNIMNETTDALQKAIAEKENAEERQGNLKRSLDRLSQIETDIKSLGIEYLEHNHTAGACPLCLTTFKYDELSERINRVREEISRDSEIHSVIETIKSLNEQISSLEKAIAQHRLIEKTARIVFTDSSFLNLTVRQIKDKFEESAQLYLDLNNLLKELDGLSDSMKRKGLTEQNFIELIAVVSKSFPQYDLAVGGLDELEKLISQANLKLMEVGNEIVINEGKLLSQTDEYRKVSTENGFSMQISQVDAAIKDRHQKVDDGLYYFAEISKFIDFNEDDSFSVLDLKIKKAIDLVTNYSNTKKKSEQFTILDSMITQTQNELDSDARPKYKRTQYALEVISKIVDQSEKDKLLKDFFESNNDQIQDIFRRIHSPRELDKVQFFSEGDQEIKIIRSTGKNSSISEISSGQRSALALAVFLTLNKKLKNGPNVLLFDDPVAYIDDLNMLSFLDYLREIVINEDRQVFFATANQKLAGFFEKKLGFLKSTGEFNNIILQR